MPWQVGTNREIEFWLLLNWKEGISLFNYVQIVSVTPQKVTDFFVFWNSLKFIEKVSENIFDSQLPQKIIGSWKFCWELKILGLRKISRKKNLQNG